MSTSSVCTDDNTAGFTIQLTVDGEVVDGISLKHKHSASGLIATTLSGSAILKLTKDSVVSAKITCLNRNVMYDVPVEKAFLTMEHLRWF
jgi:hypothetical protein